MWTTLYHLCLRKNLDQPIRGREPLASTRVPVGEAGQREQHDGRVRLGVEVRLVAVAQRTVVLPGTHLDFSHVVQAR